MTKGDFFRARSPPLDGRAGTQSMLQSMMHSRPDSPRESSRGHAIAGENSLEGNIGHSPAIGSSSPAGRSPSLSSRGHGSPISSPGLVAGLRGALSAPDDASSPPRGLGNGDLKEATVMGMAGGSDEMLMSLLAGQAAMDCENLPIKGWEEVESWKKVRIELNSVDTFPGAFGAIISTNLACITAPEGTQDCHCCSHSTKAQYWT